MGTELWCARQAISGLVSWVTWQCSKRGFFVIWDLIAVVPPLQDPALCL